MFELKVVKEETVESKLFPGVSLMLKPLTVSLRAGVELECSEYRAKILDLQIEVEDFSAIVKPWVQANLAAGAEDIDASVPIPPEVADAARKVMELRDRIDILKNGFVYPAWIKAATKKVIGVTKDNQAASVQDLVDMAPPEMLKELGKMITDKVYLPPVVQQNLESPTTSNAVGGGQSQATAATPASVPVVSSQEIAASIFQQVSSTQSTPTSPVFDGGTLTSVK